MLIDKDELLEKLEERYGDLDDDCGCYCYNENTSEDKWLSVKRIVDIIDECEDYEE